MSDGIDKNCHGAAGRSSEFMIAWMFWSLVQLLVLAVVSGRVPFAAKVPEPVETFGLVGVVFAQLLLATFLAPALLSCWTNAIFAISTAVPLIILAAMAGGGSEHSNGIIFLSALWLLTLTTLIVSRTTFAKLLFRVICLLTLLLPTLSYLQSEFAPQRQSLSPIVMSLCPTGGVLSIFTNPNDFGPLDGHFWTIWVSPISIAVLVMLYERGINRRKRSKTKTSTTTK